MEELKVGDGGNHSKEKINYISFNQEQDFFSVGTNKGFKIFKTNPLELIAYRSITA